MNKLTIAIDFDKTWIADPALWSGFAEVASVRGHEVIIVTRRYEIPAEELKSNLVNHTLASEYITCDMAFKREKLDSLGYTVDIWIDAEPGTIEPPAYPKPLS